MKTIANFGMYGDDSRIPEWIHAEKYEFCENFYNEEKKSNGIVTVIKKLFVK